MSPEVEMVMRRSMASIFEGPTRDAPPPTEGLLAAVLAWDRAEIGSILGPVGEHLRAFAEHADLAHPDLEEIADGNLSKGSVFSQTATELLGLAGFAKDRGMSLVPPHFPKILARTASHGLVSLRISDPGLKTGTNVRFIRDQKLRSDMRLRKSPQDVSLASFYTKRRDIWGIAPGSFSGFARNSRPYGEEIALLNRRIEHFNSLGLEAGAARIAARRVALEAPYEERYYGFNRCQINLASVILAKVHGFQFGKASPKAKSERLNISPEMFTSLAESGLLESVLASGGGAEYQPRIYVAESLDVPADMRRLMDRLDEFPEAGGKPIFDHFCVVLPSFTGEGAPAFSSSLSDPVREIDRRLVAARVVAPILLGEMDGRQYFLSYWGGDG